MKLAYYNEFDPKAAAWLQELINEGLIPDGKIDTRSIVDVRGSDLDGFTQCHFFAGIGGWPLALRLAGWPEDRPAWTGSAPCQPFSCAGKQQGASDDRNLWPPFMRLIRERKPQCVFGEQVEAALRSNWFDRVSADLEAEAYAVGAVVLGAHSVGAPHIRQRLYWMAYSKGGRINGGLLNQTPVRLPQEPKLNHVSESLRLDHTTSPRHAPEGIGAELRDQRGGECLPGKGCANGGMEHATLPQKTRLGQQQEHLSGSAIGFWSSAIWHQCRDGKARRISPEPSLFPLAYGLPGRVGLLRGAGNAISPPLAAEFVKAAMECLWTPAT